MKLTLYRKVILIIYSMTVVFLTIFKFPYSLKNELKHHNIFSPPIKKVVIQTRDIGRKSLTGEPITPQKHVSIQAFHYNYNLWLIEIFLTTLIFGTIYIILPNGNKTY